MTAFPREMYVAGEWRPAIGGGVLPVVDPSTEQPFAEVAYGDAADCRAAIAAAAEAFASWRWTTAYQRSRRLAAMADWLRANADEAGEAVTRETGKPLAGGRGEWVVAADLFDWYAERVKHDQGRVTPAKLPGRRLSVIKQPIGVVGVVTAWNFPAYNPARAVAAALAAGCAVVCRPSELTPVGALYLGRAAEAAGLPPGVLNVINGDPPAMAEAMLAEPACRKVSFTGSTRVGKELIRGAAATVTGLSLELDGNAPVIACEDVEVEPFAEAAVAARFRNAGQVCIAPQRFYVHESIYDRFLQLAKERVGAVRCGPWSDPANEIGPLINARQRERVARLVDDCRDRGARILAGGDVSAAPSPGYFYPPTLVADTPRDSPLWIEETFGPVLAVSPFADLEDAVADANSLEAGLAAYAFTGDLNRAVELSERLEFGMVSINGWLPHATEAPFPGWKQSGLGAESGPEGLDEYQETKVVSVGGLPGAW